jgi:hypothetical protein
MTLEPDAFYQLKQCSNFHNMLIYNILYSVSHATAFVLFFFIIWNHYAYLLLLKYISYQQGNGKVQGGNGKKRVSISMINNMCHFFRHHDFANLIRPTDI